MNVDFSTVVPIAQMAGDDDEDTELLHGLQREAISYIRAFKWCAAVIESFFGIGVGGLFAVFLVRIKPVGAVDEWHWIVVGDIPSCYLVTDHAPRPLDAMTIYCELMREWIAAVRKGEPLENVFPVRAAPTRENADQLERRLAFIESEVLPGMELG